MSEGGHDGAWYCGNRPQYDESGMKNYCPAEGCPKGYCALDAGWKHGGPSPDRCTGLAHTGGTVEAEPVAWLYGYGGGVVTATGTRYEPGVLAALGWTETPLFAHPSPAPAEPTEAMVERLVDAVCDVANIVSFDGYYEIDKEAASRAVRAIWIAMQAEVG